AGPPVSAALLAVLGIHEVAQHGVIKLDAVGTCCQQVPSFVQQNLLHSVEEVLARGIGLGRMLRGIETAKDDVSTGKSRFDGPFGMFSQERYATGHDRLLALEGSNDGGPKASPSLNQAWLKSSDSIIEDLEVPFPPPLAVRNNVDLGSLLKSNCK